MYPWILNEECKASVDFYSSLLADGVFLLFAAIAFSLLAFGYERVADAGA